jgi:hypothetical protein
VRVIYVQSLESGVDLLAASTSQAIPALYTGALGVALALPTPRSVSAVPLLLPLPQEQDGVDPNGPCLPKLHSLLSDLSLAEPGVLAASRGVAGVIESGMSITSTAAVARAEGLWRPLSAVTVTAASVAWPETPSRTLAGRLAP